ncbi:MAG: porin family protein [Bacteroidetes bacterium]|nr:porin family protein [Bacteroidota bacterium]
MKKLFLPALIALAGTFATLNVATAQSWISQGWGVGASGGIGFAIGDITTQFKDAKYHLGFSVTKELVPYFDLKGTLMQGALAGNKEDEKAVSGTGKHGSQRFRTDYFTYNAMVQFRFTDLMAISDEPKFSVYAQAGAGMLHFKSALYKTTIVNKKEEEKKVGESGTTTEITIPFGLGFEYRFTPKFSAVLDVTWHITSATKLDMVENAKFRDMMFTPGIGVNYVFSKTSKKPAPTYQQVYTPVQPVVKEVVEEVVVEEDFETVAPVAEASDDFDFDFAEPATTKPATSTYVETQPEVTAVRAGTAPATTREGLVYRVQISARQTYNANTAMSLKNKYNLPQVPFEEIDGGLYKYTIGASRSLEEANVLRETMVAKGITDAFVVPYYVGKRISNQEARNLLQR